MNAAEEVVPTTTSPLRILRVGRCSYERVWELQRLTLDALSNGGPETLILCEHDPVITLGKSASRANVLVTDEELARRGVRLVESERGGDVTYHGPGQLIGYPILDLTTKKTDVSWYMRSLEEVIIRLLAEFDIVGERIAGKTGVWVEADGKRPRKIASLGVRISRWRTMHGFALNVHSCQDGFALMHPCGLVGVEMTSIEEETKKRPALKDVQERIIPLFLDVFGLRGGES